MMQVVDKVQRMMRNPDNIRNISVIAHVDHGKTTLSDSLIGRAGLLAAAKQGDACELDTRQDEQERGITIKSTAVSLYYEKKLLQDNYPEDEKGDDNIEPYLINLIDSPGHVDFNSEVTAALRTTDGALVVACCIDGVCVQTETVLRQAISERVKPVLFLNKFDRVFMELHWTPQECYKKFRHIVESVNVICQTYKDDKLGDIELSPAKGNVGFGSGLQAWGFTLDSFADMYGQKFGLKKSKMMEKLWNNNYWDKEQMCWIKIKHNNNDENCLNGFMEFIFKPIQILFDSILNENESIYKPIISALGLKFKQKDLLEASKRPKDYLKLVMRTWLPAGDSLLNMITTHLPSPIEAQSYRFENLYSGPLDSPEANAIKTCDVNGPMSMYISKMVPSTEKGRFVAFGRVFSGSISVGQEVRIMDNDYDPENSNSKVSIKKVTSVLLMMGKINTGIRTCPAGNVCGIVGIHKYLKKCGTLTNSDKFYPFANMKFSVSCVVSVAVEPKKASDLPKLIEGLKRLSQSDQIVKCTTSENGQNIISGAGELHLEICLKDLVDNYMNGAKINITEPIVNVCETITEYNNEYPEICCSKSPNKHNRLYAKCELLSNEFIEGIENGNIKLSHTKEFEKLLENEYGWNRNDAKRIWTFGCLPDAQANVVVDCTRGQQYMNEIKDHVTNAFMGITKNGILCREKLRGCRFDIIDAKLHTDSIHRGAGQIIPAAQRVFYACQLSNNPRILEPMYLVDITVPQNEYNGAMKTITMSRGIIHNMLNKQGTPLMTIQAYLPVMESFGFTSLLRGNTHGKAFPQMKFSHWSVLPGNPFDENTKTYEQIKKVRNRKGLNPQIPSFNDFHDRIK